MSQQSWAGYLAVIAKTTSFLLADPEVESRQWPGLKVESSMFCLLKLILLPVLLDYSLGLNDLNVSPTELTVHVGDSALMGCVFQSTEDKCIFKIDWILSSGEHAKEGRDERSGSQPAMPGILTPTPATALVKIDHASECHLIWGRGRN
ncbi:hypothetical protein H8959_003010 [Pygathrix nigripes]